MDFDRLVAAHKDAVYRQMIRTCGNKEDAEDVLVEALVAAFKHGDQLKDEGAFRGWVTSIGNRVCGRLRRREALVQILGGEAVEWQIDQSPDAEDLLQRKEMKSCIDRAVSSLKPGEREVYELRELQEFTTEETADRLSVSVAAVKSRLHRARAHLRSKLDDMFCDQFH